MTVGRWRLAVGVNREGTQARRELCRWRLAVDGGNRDTETARGRGRVFCWEDGERRAAAHLRRLST